MPGFYGDIYGSVANKKDRSQEKAQAKTISKYLISFFQQLFVHLQANWLTVSFSTKFLKAIFEIKFGLLDQWYGSLLCMEKIAWICKRDASSRRACEALLSISC